MSWHDFLIWLATHQDYGWALVLMAWSFVAVLHWRRALPAGENAWVPGVATGLVLLAILELWLLATPVDPLPYLAWRIAWDASICTVVFGLGLALGLSACSDRRARLACGFAAILIIGLAVYGTRAIYPPGWGLPDTVPVPDPLLRAPVVVPHTEISAVSTVVATRISAAVHVGGGLPLYLLLLVAGVARCRPAIHRREWRALLGVVAGLWFGSAGPLADLALIPRAYTDLSLFGPWSCLGLLAAATVLLRDQVQALLRREGLSGEAFTREWRQILLWTGACVLIGGLLAAVWGAVAQRQFEQGAVSRVRALSILIDTALLARETGPDLRLDEFTEDTAGGRPFLYARSHRLAAGGLRPLELQLAEIERVNPDIRNALITTLRQGFLVNIVASARAPGWRNEVVINRRVTAGDLLAWDNRRAFFLPPDAFYFGEIAQSFAPLAGPDGRMLGWLEFSYGSSTWRAPAVYARFLVFLSVALGLALFGLYFRLRAQVRRQQQMQVAEAAARESVRAKTAFLAQVSHELRTPIQSILGYGELLARQPLSPEARRWLESIRSHGQLLTRLVNDLIDLSALQVGAFRLVAEPGDLASLVRSVADSLEPRAAAKGLRLECAITLTPTESGRLFDRERVRQILLNLAGNALKFTSRGFVRIEVLPAEEGITVRVTDSGPGIPAAEQTRLFQPFSRLPGTQHIEGAGLGLALTAGLCAAMGGRLTVESDGATGTTFTATLPLPAAGLPDTQTLPTWQSLQGRRLLVVDDNTLVRELFAACLAAQGADCETVADGESALARCQTEPPDVVVLDISMPGIDGYEVARRLRRLTVSPRLVGVSAHADGAERARALQAGMDAFLVKPVALPDLIQAVAASPTGPGRAAPYPLRLEHMRAIFSQEAPDLRREIRLAAAAGDLERLRARIHYLRNSADIARYDELGLLCAQLETLLAGRTGRFEDVLQDVDRVLAAFGPDAPPTSAA